MLTLGIVGGVAVLLGILYLLATRVWLIKRIIASCLFLSLEEIEE